MKGNYIFDQALNSYSLILIVQLCGDNFKATPPLVVWLVGFPYYAFDKISLQVNLFGSDSPKLAANSSK